MATSKGCVAYMRYSTDNQTENSIEYQRAEIQRYCDQKGLTLRKEFIDEAYSATNDRRPDFQRMIAESESSPDWDTILVYDSSRIFRNASDASQYRTYLRDCGITIVSIKEKFPSSAMGRFAESMTDTVNAFYCEQAKEKTHDGMRVKAEKAQHCGGVPPLGYDVDADGKLVINEAEAGTVREIFRLYNAGYSYNKMVKDLNDKGLRTKAGKPFTKHSFSSILTQEKYIGIYRWNKRRAKNSKGRYNNHAYKPVEEQTVIEGGCPAIIPLKQFQAAQKKLSQRSRGRADTKSRKHYMLSGMKRLKCAECGSYMVGKVTASHGKKYTTYACPKHKGGGCPTKDIPARGLEEYTAFVIIKALRMGSDLPQLNQCLKSGGDAETQRLQNRLTSVEKKLDNIVRNLENGYSKTLTDRLQLLEEEKASLTSQIQAASRTIPSITKENLRTVKNRLADRLIKSDDPEVRELLMAYISEITVSNDDVTVNLQV